MFNWEFAFCCYGLVSLVWTILWLLFSKDFSERDLKLYPYGVCYPDKLEFEQQNTTRDPSWKKLLLNRQFLVASFGHFCYGILANVVIVVLPRYIAQVHGLGLLVNGLITSLPFFAQICSSITVCVSVGKNSK